MGLPLLSSGGSKGGEVSPLLRSGGSKGGGAYPPYLDAEIGYFVDVLQWEPSRCILYDGWVGVGVQDRVRVMIYWTYSRGVLLALDNLDFEISCGDVKFDRHDSWLVTSLAYLVTQSDRDRFVSSNKNLRESGRISCNNMVETDLKSVSVKVEVNEIANGEKISIFFRVKFDRYLKKSRYEGFYKRYYLDYCLENLSLAKPNALTFDLKPRVASMRQ